jgi:hypothetical protein
MLNAMKNLNQISILCVSVLFLLTVSACSDSVVDSEPDVATLRVDLNQFRAIKDCDGIEGRGDFNFSMRVELDNGEIPYRINGRSVELSDDENSNIGQEVVFTQEEIDGASFKVYFSSSEWDKPLIGASYPDDRMNNITKSISHQFANGVWSNTGSRRIVNGSGDCQAELRYSFNVN